MKREAILSARITRTGAKSPRCAASKAAARFRRPNLLLELLEDRTMLSGPGDIEWLRQFGSFSPGTGASRAVDTDGNAYVAGQVSGALPGQTFAGGDADAFVRKYDANGTELWTRQFGTALGDQALGIAVDASGVYVVGFTGGVNNLGDLSDAFVRKYDPDGNELWTRQFGGASADQAFAVAVDSSGVYVAGLTGGIFSFNTTSDAFVRKYDAAGNELWTRQFGSTSADMALGVAADASGVSLSGATWGTFPGQIRAGDVDAFVRKYDANGNELWTRQFGTAGDDRALGIAVDASGMYVAGSVAFALPGQINPGAGSDAFVRKYDAAGNVIWTRQFGSTSFDGCTGVAVDASGVYVAGATFGTLPGQISAGSTDAFVRKYDAAGNVVWTRQFGTVNQDLASVISLDASGAYYVAWFTFPAPGSIGGESAFVRKYDAGGNELWTRQFAGFFPGASEAARAVDFDGNVYVAGAVGAALPGQTSFGLDDAFVRKYDAAGNVIWTRQFGTSSADSILGIAVDDSGLYVAGFTNGALPSQVSAGSGDAFVRRYDLAGNMLWTRQFGTSGTDQGASVAVDASGLYISGFTTGAFPGQSNAGGLDAFVRKYDAAGNELWTRQFGTTGFDGGSGVAVDASGVYVAGGAGAALPGQTGAGGSDGFVRKYDTSGTEIWTSQFGTADSDGANGIAVDASGIYVTGDTFGTFPGQSSAGSRDAFVRKYDAAGNALWTRQFGSAMFDGSLAVALGPSGVYLAGFVGSFLPGQTSAGFSDAFVRKYNASGSEIWTRQFGTAGSDVAVGVAVSDSGLYIAGTTGGAFPGQVSSGGADVFVSKMVDGGAINTAPSDLNLALSATIDENSTATLSGSFTDPDAADTHTVVIDWGAGEGTTTLNLAAGVTTFSASHVYLDDSPPGTASDVYTVSATVIEPAGGSASGSTSITVNNVAPTAVNDLAVTNEQQPVTIAVLADDSDVAGALDALQINSVTNGSQGVTAIDTKGTADTADDEIVYTPNPGATGNDSFTYTISDGDGGTATATVSVQIRNLVDLSGRVFDDQDNDGTYEPEGGDVGIGGVSVQLFDEMSGAMVAAQTTAGDGTYFFDVNLGAGTYKVVAAQPAGFLDGRETAGNIGGTVNDTQDSHQITGIRVGESGTTADAIDYLFAEILPSQAQGLVWLDADNDGEVDFGESAIAGVVVELTGLDDRGQAISRSAMTDADGVYAFLDLRPSSAAGYTIREIQPAAYADGRDILGTVNGVAVGGNPVNDTFSEVALPRPNSLAENYNFGEQSRADDPVQPGQTATIGFWQNKNGQNLIQSLNGDPTSTQLGNWLAAMFPNMYGALAGANNLAGKTNADIAAFYKTLFARTSCNAAGGGPPKMDAQVLATALAVYVTNRSLAGTTAAAYGFLVTDSGVGTRTFNMGCKGAAFGVANNASVTALDLLLAVNSRSRKGRLYDLDGDGDANDSLETSYRTMANDVFSAINEAGDI